MNVKKSVLLGVVAILALLGGLGQSAYAKHGPKPPKMHYKIKKSWGPYGGNYLAPKKQHRPTGWYRSSLTGKMVYGKQKK